ncbi:hypothetical protein MMPV_006862 [Pyropia vietnamensis]
MATPRVAEEDDAFVLDEGLNEADEELVAFGATDADADGGGQPAPRGGLGVGGVAGSGGGATGVRPTAAGATTAAASVGVATTASVGDANGSTRKELAGDNDRAAAGAPAVGTAATLAARPPLRSGLHGVVVSNVTGDGHTEELLEILVCCGPLAGSAFEPLGDGTLVGMALFEEAEAVEAALTLDGSRFQGRTLAVVREPSVAAAPTADAALAALPGLVRQHQAALTAGATTTTRDAHSGVAASDVQAAILRSVSVVGEESRKLSDRIQAAPLTRAAAASAADAAAATRRAWADVEAEYHVSERVAAVRASAGQTAANVDAQLHVSERVGDAVSVLRRGAGDLDASLGVTSGISALASSVGGATRKIAGEVDETWNVSTRARVAAATAMENEGVRSVLATWNSWMAPLQGGQGGGGGEGHSPAPPVTGARPGGEPGGTPRREDVMPSPSERREPGDP